MHPSGGGGARVGREGRARPVVKRGLKRRRKCVERVLDQFEKAASSESGHRPDHGCYEQRGAGQPKVAAVSGSRALNSPEGDYLGKGEHGRPSGGLYGIPGAHSKPGGGGSNWVWGLGTRGRCRSRRFGTT